MQTGQETGCSVPGMFINGSGTQSLTEMHHLFKVRCADPLTASRAGGDEREMELFPELKFYSMSSSLKDYFNISYIVE